MQKYLVVSYDDDQQQWFWDTVAAESRDQAQEFICKVRPYVIAAEASSGADFGINLRVEILRAEWDASEELDQCDACASIFPRSRLTPVKDIAQRVAPGEPMPSGECPAYGCGALCHPLKI